MRVDFQIITMLSDSERTKVYLVALQDSSKQFAILKKHRDTELLDCYQRIESLQSEYFPKLYEIWEENGEINVLEEYISGETLQERLEREPLLVERELTLYLRELCRALQVLHHANPPIIHRDIKPSNVMITDAGEIRLLDFDASRQYKEERERDTVLLGTREYASPEQFGFMQTDVRSDIYSWGIVYSEMLEHSLVSRVYAKRAKKMIDRATMFDPRKRYPDTDALLKDLIHPGVSKKIYLFCIAVSFLCLSGVIVTLRTGEPENKPVLETSVSVAGEKEPEEISGSVAEDKKSVVATEEKVVEKSSSEGFWREEAVPLEEAYHYVSIEEEFREKQDTIAAASSYLYWNRVYEDNDSGLYSDNQETVIGREYVALRFLKAYPRDIILHSVDFEGMEIQYAFYNPYLEEEGIHGAQEVVPSSYYAKEFGNVISISAEFLSTLDPGLYTFTVSLQGENNTHNVPFYLVVHGEEEDVSNFRVNTLSEAAYYSSESENNVVFYLQNTPYPIKKVKFASRVLDKEEYQLVDDGFGVVFSAELLKQYEEMERVDIILEAANGKMTGVYVINLKNF